jgi:hypothetical protein
MTIDPVFIGKFISQFIGSISKYLGKDYTDQLVYPKKISKKIILSDFKVKII